MGARVKCIMNVDYEDGKIYCCENGNLHYCDNGKLQ